MLSYCCFLSWRLLRHQFENRDVRLVSHQLLGVGGTMPHECKAGPCRGGSRAWPGKALLSCHWLTIKLAATGQNERKSSNSNEISNSHCHSQQVGPAAAQGRAAATRVFTDLRGGMLCVSNYRTWVCASAAKCRKADGTFPVITPHDLRHTAASLPTCSMRIWTGLQTGWTRRSNRLRTDCTS